MSASSKQIESMNLHRKMTEKQPIQRIPRYVVENSHNNTYNVQKNGDLDGVMKTTNKKL